MRLSAVLLGLLCCYSCGADWPWWKQVGTVPPVPYCQPHNTSCWPTDEDISQLTSDLGGSERLLLPGSVPYEAYSKMNWNGHYRDKPAFIALAETTEDVQKCVKFVHSYKLEVSVVSSGHSFIGRNTGNGTFQINMKNMNNASVNLACAENADGCITAQPGCSWGQLYELVDGYDRLVVGGSQPTVSVSGYTLGGGHSPYSRLFGIAVDNVLEITLVGPDASVTVVNGNGYTQTFENGSAISRADDPDLWWALRGGGGSTFGVVVGFVFKLHLPPDGGVTQLFCLFGAFYGTYPLAKDFFTWYHEYSAEFPERVGGYILGGASYQASYVLVSLLHMGGVEQAEETFNPLVERLHFGGTYNPCSYRNYTSFWEYERNVTDASNGSVAFIANNLIQPGPLATNAEDFAEKMMKPITELQYDQSGSQLSYTFTHIGGVSARNPDTAVTSGFRKGIYSLSFGTGFTGGPDNYEADALRVISLQHELGSFTEGEYFNECLINHTTWRSDYWSDYDRLVNFKSRWDPNNVFYCKQCVGAVDNPADISSATALNAVGLCGVLSFCAFVLALI